MIGTKSDEWFITSEAGDHSRYFWVVVKYSIHLDMNDLNIISGLFVLIIVTYVGFVLTGILMLRNFIEELLGSRSIKDEIIARENQVISYKSILGFPDYLVHNYGPNKKFASVHIEVEDSLSLNQAHKIIDIIEKDFKKSLDLALVCYVNPGAVNNQIYIEILKQLKEIVKEL